MFDGRDPTVADHLVDDWAGRLREAGRTGTRARGPDRVRAKSDGFVEDPAKVNALAQLRVLVDATRRVA